MLRGFGTERGEFTSLIVVGSQDVAPNSAPNRGECVFVVAALVSLSCISPFKVLMVACLLPQRVEDNGSKILFSVVM